MMIKNIFKTLFSRHRRRLSLHERFRSVKEYKDFQLKRLIKRADNDLSQGNLKKAISRFEGFLKYNSTNQEIHNLLGDLYYKIDDKILAGKHFYFKEDVSAEENECINLFKKSLGNCPLNIAQKLMYKNYYKISRLSTFTKKQYYSLIIEIESKFQITPKFMIALKGHLEKNGFNK